MFRDAASIESVKCWENGEKTKCEGNFSVLPFKICVFVTNHLKTPPPCQFLRCSEDKIKIK